MKISKPRHALTRGPSRLQFRILVVSLALLSLSSASPSNAQPWHFTDVTAAAGVMYLPGYDPHVDSAPRVMGGGAAAGDYDGDGRVDLYVTRGDTGPNFLFHNKGDGTFEEVGAAAGLTIRSGSGPTFADIDGDGRLDLVLGGIDGAAVAFFRNVGGGHFATVTTPTGVHLDGADVYSTAFGDYDRDGDLDLATTHWASFHNVRLWRNDGNFHFTEVTGPAGLTTPAQSNSFTANFVDLNNDEWPDITVSADFGTSQYYLNNRNGTFTRATNAVISDENGMGSAIGDFDNDGDLDWFVSSIWSPTGTRAGGQGITGNRLYRNRGDGQFDDVTDQAGVRHGYWGWGSTFADLNNDGHLDIFHVNGFPTAEFNDDPARLFVSNGNGTFTQQADTLGVADTGEGRGVVCFDYDGDGDLDLFITNMEQPGRLYRNDLPPGSKFLAVKLTGEPPNTQAIGARIFVTVNGVTQMRELRAASNFVSQDPVEAWFGLGGATTVPLVRVVFPDGTQQTLQNVAANQTVVVGQGLAPQIDVPTLGGVGIALLGVLLASVAVLLIARGKLA